MKQAALISWLMMLVLVGLAVKAGAGGGAVVLLAGLAVGGFGLALWKGDRPRKGAKPTRRPRLALTPIRKRKRGDRVAEVLRWMGR